MDSKAINLPVIDFSGLDLKPGNPTWNSAKGQVRRALEEFGCFNALYDKIPTEIRKALFESSAMLFDLPLEHKVRNTSNKIFHGYIGPHAGSPLYESMGVDKPTLREKVESFTDIMWPKGNSNFSKTIQSYSEQLSELDKTVRMMVLESLGLEKYFDEHMDSSFYHLRVMNYKAPQTSETMLGLIAHTDKNLLSILDQNQTKGLEVLTKDGQWVEVNFCPNSFFVLIGDVFHAWTNGRLYSPHHRVMMTGNSSRYSVGLFSNSKPGYIVKAPKELVDEEHPPLFKPFDVFGLIEFYTTEEAQKSQSTLKAYCGV